MENPSLKTNMILNIIRTIIGIIIPLITFPYITRILGVDVFGRVTFANSIIAYFIMIADLGIKLYAVSKGPIYRDSKADMEKFANSVFSINVISTIFSYILLIVIILITPQLKEYNVLLAILSLKVFLSTIGIEWLFMIYEDFKYITIRTIILNIISVIILFLFVKNPSDVVVYAIILVISSSGANIVNYFYSRKYLTIKFTFNFESNIHLRPILVLFATQAAVFIYVSSDVTILGFLCGPVVVGLYTVAAKLYEVLKSIVASIVSVVIPRMSSVFGTGDRTMFDETGDNAYYMMMTLCIPIIIGTILLSSDIVIVFAGSEYEEASLSVIILSIAIFFCVGAYFWSQAVLVPVGREKSVFYATIYSGGINILLNILLIPIWKYNAASLTTLISELFTYFYCRQIGKKYIYLRSEFKIVYKSLICCWGIVVSAVGLRCMDITPLIYISLVVLISILTYCITGYYIKNEAIMAGLNNIKSVIINKATNRQLLK